MRILTPLDNTLPLSLRTIKPKVKQLYVKGNSTQQLSRLDRSITIVGSRKMTRYGAQVIEKIVPALVNAGIVIISGFMYGVDQYVHQVCLDSGGSTIAVLGWGIDRPVLPVEVALYQKIEKEGLIVSEYEKDTKPQLWMFPARDRIMAGLAQATLVIEAAKRSGSLLTANFAKRYKRKLFSVPGPITSAVSCGTNGLIKSGQAIMVDSPQDILAVMNWPNIFKKVAVSQQSSQILRLLENEPLLMDEIVVKLKKSPEQIGAELSMLQLQGEVFEQQGKYYLNQNALSN